MKLLLVLLAVGVLLWLLRGGLRGAQAPAPKPPVADPPRPMLACAQCGIHLPIDEALPGRGGVFCGAAHRAAFEAAHPE
ncbi:MAG: PP0621 family protein [Caldimonas sp.]